MKILYLVNKNTYINKLSRVRFHAIESLSKIPNITVSIWGKGWIRYDETKSVQENIDLLGEHFDFVIVYKPGELNNFEEINLPSSIRYNEMWDISHTLNEINMSKSNLIICHHENDLVKYQTELAKQLTHWTRMIYIPHCAKKEIFYDRKCTKSIDILLCGSVGRHYPLRQRLRTILQKFPSKYICQEYTHPGYILKEAYTDFYLNDFAEKISQTKICISCTSKYKYRLGKMVEIPMCNSVLACDIPDQEPGIYNDSMMITINQSMNDNEITSKLIEYLEDPIKLEKVRNGGYNWASKYTQTYYANELLKNIQYHLNTKPKIFVIGDELKNLQIKWICDVFKEEFIEYSELEITDKIEYADIIWLMAPWTMRKFNYKHFENKFVITTIHHIDWDKYEKNYYERIEKITNKYHVICPLVFNELKKITSKPIIVANFWINELNYFHIEDKYSLRTNYSIPIDAYVIGSFQKDTEGADNMTPKLSKGPDIFLKIIEDMNKTRKNIFVILTGWRRSYVMSGLDKLGIQYIFFELVETKIINELYNCLDLYIVSSRVEGGPRSIIECGLAKVPIISTKVGISELILNNSSIYSWELMNWDKAQIDVIFAYTKSSEYSIKNYMNKFVKKVFELK